MHSRSSRHHDPSARHHDPSARHHDPSSRHHDPSSLHHDPSSRHHDPRQPDFSFRHQERPRTSPYQRVRDLNPPPGPFVRPANAHAINQHLRRSSQHELRNSDWQHQAAYNDWSVTHPPHPPPIASFDYFRDVPPPQAFLSPQLPNVHLPSPPPPNHSGPERISISPPQPSLLSLHEVGPIAQTFQSGPSEIHPSTTQPRLDVNETKRTYENDGMKENECEKIGADRHSLDGTNKILENNRSPCSAAGETKSDHNRVIVKEEVLCPNTLTNPLLKVKSEEVLFNPLLISAKGQNTIEAKVKTSLKTGQLNKRVDSKQHSSPDSSIDAVSRDHVLYRFLVSELAMKGLSRCMDDAPAHTTVDEAQLVQDVLLLLLFLKSHGDVELVCDLGVVDVLAARKMKGNYVVTHLASSKIVTLSISEHNYFKNFVRNVRPALTQDSYGVLFKNGESRFCDISLRQALRYCWAKAQVGLDASVLWTCLGQVPGDCDSDTFEAASSASENQVPPVEQAFGGKPSKSQTEDFSPANVLEDRSVVEESTKSLAEDISPATAILEQEPIVEESPKSRTQIFTPAAILEKQPMIEESPKSRTKIPQAAVILEQKSVVEESPKRRTKIPPHAVILERQPVVEKSAKRRTKISSPTASLEQQPVVEESPKHRTKIPPHAVILERQPVVEKSAKRRTKISSPTASLEQQPVVEESPKRRTKIPPHAVILERQPVVEKSAKRRTKISSPTASLEQQPVVKESPKHRTKIPPHAVILERQPVVEKSAKRRTKLSSPTASLEQQPVVKESPKRRTKIPPHAVILERQPVVEKSAKRRTEISSPTAILEQQPVVEESPKRRTKIPPATTIMKEHQPVARKLLKSAVEDASPVVQATPNKDAVSFKKLEIVKKKRLQKLTTTNPMSKGKQIHEKQRSRWPLSVLHELCPGLRYTVSEDRAPGLYYPVFAVSADVGGRRFTQTAPAVKRAKFLLAQTALKSVYNIDNVHEGLPTAVERKEAKRKEAQRERRNKRGAPSTKLVV